ncbi:SH3 domain-containing protein [Neolewinella antarctica]|uniref:SH3b domain-containing protein n=1 Tax=Neolewinella antarctica TaxID=442734 RepID=A0ABX0XCN1_9BACT|nr:SH3 domain-containing protein [Neolewinella antarctica]NJC26825.1 hypothetical protein [Neolewinella antarctica]
MNRLLPLFIFSLLIAACGDADNAESPDEVAASVSPTTPAPATAPKPTYGNDRRAWVDGLNLRKEPRTGSEILTQLSTTDELTLTGQKSAESDAVVLRGVLYREPWYEIKTEAGQTGWVFGGAIKAEGESKGNRNFTATDFNYPYLGQFNLSRWEAAEAVGEDGGDYERSTTTYRGDGQVMTVTSAEGEYGLFTDHVLMNAKGDTLRARHFEFSNSALELFEEVIDYTGSEPMVHTRRQQSPKPYQQLSGRPEMVRGAWTSKRYAPGETIDIDI